MSRVKQKKIAPLTFRMFEHKIYFKYCRKEACFADLEEQEMLKGKRTIHISVWILAVLLSTMQTVGCRISVFYHSPAYIREALGNRMAGMVADRICCFGNRL